MKDINKIILVGRLGADPVQRQTKSGISVVHLSVATSRRIAREGSGPEGESNFTEETQWHRVIVWARQGEACAQYLKKGSAVYIEGFLRSHSYDDKAGNSKKAIEIYAENVSFLDTRKTQSNLETQEGVQSKIQTEKEERPSL